MDSIVVQGGGPLNGQIPIAGAKNACLTLMPATLLSEEPLTLTNAPRLSDIKTMTELLQSLGAEITSMQEGQVQAMSCHGTINTRANMTLCAKCGRRTLCLGRFWRVKAWLKCPCQAAVQLARALWTFTPTA